MCAYNVHNTCYLYEVCVHVRHITSAICMRYVYMYCTQHLLSIWSMCTCIVRNTCYLYKVCVHVLYMTSAICIRYVCMYCTFISAECMTYINLCIFLCLIKCISVKNFQMVKLLNINSHCNYIHVAKIASFIKESQKCLFN